MTVLELVAESVRTAGLVERRPRPHTARERLVQQPGVEHDVHGAVRRLHLDGAEHAVPVVRHRLQGLPMVGGPVAPDQLGSQRRVRRLSEQDRTSARPPGTSSTLVWSAAHGSSPAPTLPERACLGSRPSGRAGRSVATEELGPVAGPGGLEPAEVEERHAAAELDVPRVPRQERPRPGLPRGDDVRRGCSTRGPQCPFRIGGHGQASGTTRTILDAQHGDLQRVVEGYELHQLERDTVVQMLEAAVAGAMAGDVRRPFASDG